MDKRLAIELYDYDMPYSDWTTLDTIEIRKTYVARDIIACIETKYLGSASDNERINRLTNKVITAHQKLVMMMFAEYNIHKAKNDFESTQNMDVPALCGMGNTKILFYVESMILFARNALDVAATVYADLFFDKRMDSFNDFSKRIIKSDDSVLKKLGNYFRENDEGSFGVFRLLCGSERGRALRDIIVHQANIKLEYYEYKEHSEKERLYLILKDTDPIEFDWFISSFIDEFEEIFNQTTACCKEYLKKNKQQK